MGKLAFVVTVTLALAAGCDKKKPVEPETPVDTKETKTSEVETTGDESTETAATNSASLKEIIYFEFDSSDLPASAREDLERNATWLREDDKRTLRIEGHTDESGTAEYNLGLGERRAKATMDYLVRLGIDASRIEIITFGEEKPADTSDEKNRRSVFVATRK